MKINENLVENYSAVNRGKRKTSQSMKMSKLQSRVVENFRNYSKTCKKLCIINVNWWKLEKKERITANLPKIV